jgi:citrate lyase subunit beta/citryl-CoA lyase
MRARRSCLSVPGSADAKLAKAAGLGADEVVVDLEDSVVAAAKEDARRTAASALDRGVVAAEAAAVRVNWIGSPWFAEDVAALGGRVQSLVLPKVEDAADVERAAARLDSLGEDARDVRLQALVETAGGLLRVGEIAFGSPRLEALILGYADLAASLGRASGADAPESWLHAQEAVLVAARAASLQAIDGPYLAIRDDEGLRLRAEHARRLGYDGKWAIHPRQVPILNEAFTPAHEDVEHATAVVAALERAEGEDSSGVVELDGEMIDEASRKLALQTVARARAAGLA